jgi:hypothetical protein
MKVIVRAVRVLVGIEIVVDAVIRVVLAEALRMSMKVWLRP